MSTIMSEILKEQVVYEKAAVDFFSITWIDPFNEKKNDPLL